MMEKYMMRNRIDVAGYMNVEQMIIEINTSISVFRRTHKGAHRHTLVCTASRCCALLQHAFTSYFHTRTFTQMLLHTSQHTHTSLYTHIFTHMRLHSGFSTQAVAHMQYTYVFTQALLHILNTDTHALVHKHSCTHTLLHKPFHTHMLRQLFEEASTSRQISMLLYIHICIYIYMCIYIYVYVYVQYICIYIYAQWTCLFSFSHTPIC